MAIDVCSSLPSQPSNGIQSNGNGHSSTAVASTTATTATAAIVPNKNENSAYTNNNKFRLHPILTRGRIGRIINPQILPILGLFVFYIAHDALQERMFRFDGFEFGFFMTLVEVLVMLVGSTISEGESGVVCTILFSKKKNSKSSSSSSSSHNHHHHQQRRRRLSLPTFIRMAWVGIFLALAHGLGNTSLNYSPYPLKVAFKSCKLVPTMALGACVTGRKHTALQYTAALVMGMGLAVLTAADVFSTKQKVPLSLHNDGLRHHHGSNAEEWSRELGPFVGPILLTISTVFDSIVPNLQEQLLTTAKVKTSEMILVSNMVMCVVLVIYTIYNGELRTAWEYCSTHHDASMVLLAQGFSAYFGLQCYLAIIRDYGGVIGVLLANARKIATIILSFVLFAKPFNERHVVGLMLVFVGVYLGYISKRGEKKKKGKGGGGGKRKSGRKVRRKSRRKSEDHENHEHNV